jgi:hypothetical protein
MSSDLLASSVKVSSPPCADFTPYGYPRGHPDLIAFQLPFDEPVDVKLKYPQLSESQIVELEYAEFMAMDDPMKFIYRLGRIKQQHDVDLNNLLGQLLMEALEDREKKEIKSQYRRKFVELRLQFFRQMSEVDPYLHNQPHCDEMDAKVYRFLTRWEELHPTSVASVSLQNDVAVQSSSAPVLAHRESVLHCIQPVLVQPVEPVVDQVDVASVTPGLRKRRRNLSPQVPVGSLTLFQIDFDVTALNPEFHLLSELELCSTLSHRVSSLCRNEVVSSGNVRLPLRYRSRSGFSDGHRDRLVPVHSKWD